MTSAELQSGVQGRWGERHRIIESYNWLGWKGS